MINTESIRACMIKYPTSSLWDKSVKVWSDKDKKTFNLMLSGALVKRKMKVKRVNPRAIKVVRLSDGEVYESITACIIANDFYKTEMRVKLKAGIEFKTI